MTHLHDATNPNCTHYQENGTPQANAPTSSRRRRLWELTHACHCPVVGVCIPLDTLRRLVNKALGGKALADDYEVHVGAVAECMHLPRCGARPYAKAMWQAPFGRRWCTPAAMPSCKKCCAVTCTCCSTKQVLMRVLMLPASQQCWTRMPC